MLMENGALMMVKQDIITHENALCCESIAGG